MPARPLSQIPLRSMRTRRRSDLSPVTSASTPPIAPSRAENDFLVPNPRPDLTLDLATLGMIETA